jgi:hypothetical protein
MNNIILIKLTTAVVLPTLLLCSCASQGMYMAIPDTKGGKKMGKVMGNSGDWTGNIKYEQRGNYVKLEITQPDGDVPMMQRAVVHKGKLLGYEQIPVIASISNSRVNDSMWGGISKGIRSISNLVGTVIAGMIGIEAAQQIGTAVTAWAPKEAAKATTTTPPTAAPVVPEIPAAGSATTATIPATVVPEVTPFIPPTVVP